MRTEKIVYMPEIVQSSPMNNHKDSEIGRRRSSGAKNAALLTAALLSLASMAKADVNMKKTLIDPYDLSYESTNKTDRNLFRNYLASNPGIKRYSRVDKNTLRTINEDDKVVDYIIKDGVHNTVVVGYAPSPDLYPNGHDIPLSEQKYDDYETYKRTLRNKKIVKNSVKYGLPLSVGLLLTLIVYNKTKEKNPPVIDDVDDKMDGYGSGYIEQSDE